MVQRKLPKISLLLAIILILSAFLRLYRIGDYMEFLGDQGRDLVIVRDFLIHHNIFFIGPQTSIGNMYLGPFYYYFFVAPGLLLSWFNPIGPSIVVALLGVLTVYLLNHYLTSWFDQKTGYIAAFLYATSPVVIKYSNFSWNPNVMPLFALLFFSFCLSSNFILAALAFIICLNSHYLALLLLPIGLLIYLQKLITQPEKRPKLFRQAIVAVLIFLVSLTPQILFDLKHHGQNLGALATFFTQRETTVNLKAYKAVPGLWPLFTQVNTRLLAGKDLNFGLALSLVFLFLIIWQLLSQFRQHRFNPAFNWLLLWYLVGLIGLALYKQHIYDHYFGFLFPVAFALLAYLLARLPKMLMLICLIVISYFSLIQNPFRWAPPSQMSLDNQIIDQISKKAQGKPFNFALLAKQNYDPPYRYLASIKNLPMVNLHDQMTDQLFVVCEPHPDINCNPINNPSWDIAAFGWIKITDQWEVNGVKVYRTIHTQK